MPPLKNTRQKKKLVQGEPQTDIAPPIKKIGWPPIEFDSWKSDNLQLVHLVPGQIVTIPNFWSAALCKKYVSFLKDLPLVTTPGTPRRGDAVRVNDRFQIDDAAFADSLWNAGLKHLVLDAGPGAIGEGEDQLKQLWGGEVVGLSPNIRIYRYSKGQFFDKHYDDSNHLLLPGSFSTPARTTWTLLLYLTSPTTGCLGGETVFYPEALKKQQAQAPVVVGLETGMALLHKHGKECMLHEGREVLGGEKWVIRSDLCVRR